MAVRKEMMWEKQEKNEGKVLRVATRNPEVPPAALGKECGHANSGSGDKVLLQIISNVYITNMSMGYG
jgi:hypothetical protein